MNLKWAWVSLSLLVIVNSLPESDLDLDTGLRFTGLGYEDACNKAAQLQWNFLNQPNNENLQLWEDSLIEYADYKRSQELDISNKTNESDLSETIQYKSNLVSKPGDALLQREEYREFISFIGQAEYLRLSKNYTAIDKILSSTKSSSEKLKSWSSWYETFKSLENKFPNNFRYLKNAAKANGENDVQVYWELLSGLNRGYDDAREKWTEILPFYTRLVKFVKTRLSDKYKDVTITDTLPVHLLGSLESYDWTQLALDVIPFPNVTYNIRKNLLNKKLMGKELYKSASHLGKDILKHLPNAEFFHNSVFDGNCRSQLINFCRKGSLSISTCSESSIGNFISAHKNVGKILVHQMAEESNPILNDANRYSALEEGIGELFGILSSSHAWLHTMKLVNETDDPDQVRIVSLMITALDILPRMAYYLTADTWRLDAIQNNSFDSSQLLSTWWQYRSEFGNVSTSLKDVPTFLDDSYIINNRPYLSKFMGVLLGFQIYEYLMDSTEIRIDKIEPLKLKPELIKMIKDGSADNWYEMIKKYLDFNEVSVDALVNFFIPLENYFERMERDNQTLPVIPTDLELKLEKLEDQYKRDLTTTTTPTTTTTTTTTTVKPKVVSKDDGKMVNDGESIDKKVPKNAQLNELNKSALPPQEIKNDIQLTPEEKKRRENEIAKSGKKKAVWAVGSVLAATVGITIIAIFGKRRCRKTPKNRRYV